jgi:transcriptional regulator with XRE-family HTH domain
MLASLSKPTILIPVSINHGKMKKLREKLGLSQEEAAKAAGLAGRQKWNSYEMGRSEPRVSTLLRIAAVLRTSVDSLLKK